MNDLRNLPVGTPVHLLGDEATPYKTASAPIHNTNGTVSYYLKTDDRHARFAGIYSTQYLQLNQQIHEAAHGEKGPRNIQK